MVHPLLPLIPADAERVKIKNKDGTESFVFVQDLKDSDDVVLSSSNLPVITKKAYGRPKGSKKQKGLAAIAEPRKKITGADLKKAKKMSSMKKMGKVK